MYSSVVRNDDDDDEGLRFSQDGKALPKRRVSRAQRSFLPTAVEEEVIGYSELTRLTLMTSDSV